MPNIIEQVAICDEYIENEDDVNFLINKIGGVPKFLPEKVFEFKKCDNCGQSLIFIGQFYCPLNDSIYHRVFHILACANRLCWNKSNSWTVYRSQYPDFDYIKSLEDAKRERENAAKKVSFINNSNDWGFEVASDWDDDTNEDNKVNLPQNLSYFQTNEEDNLMDTTHNLSDALKSLNLTSKEKASNKVEIDDDDDDDINVEINKGNINQLKTTCLDDTMQEMFNNWKKNLNTTNLQTMNIDNNNNNCNIGVFKPFYLNVMNKSIFVEQEKPYSRITFDNINELNDEKSDNSITKAEEYEEDNLKHGDKLFYKFRKSIDFCPYQVVRYARGANPLFIKSNEDFDLDDVECTYCASKCQFEFQLMPALVNYLKTNINNNVSVEFGVVIVYTCLNNCWSNEDFYRLEHVYVQSDPDERLFSTSS